MSWIVWSLLGFVLGAAAQEVQDGPKNGPLQCYYCGITDNCRIPYTTEAENGAKNITCDKSCVKFDGIARDGKRVIVRNCGYFKADECVEGAYFEDPDTIGTICHCLTDKCNHSDFLKLNILLLIPILLRI